jgi:hypothetical protein
MSATSSQNSAQARRPDIQTNFKCNPALRDAFDAVCAATGASRTERLTQYMEAVVAQRLEGRLHHLDGSLCPLSACTIEITKTVRSSIVTLAELAKRGQLTEIV